MFLQIVPETEGRIGERKGKNFRETFKYGNQDLISSLLRRAASYFMFESMLTYDIIANNEYAYERVQYALTRLYFICIYI